ncbi:MAG: NADH-quinone oxidoreductase subunit J family protein [Actinomycetota bacterium]
MQQYLFMAIAAVMAFAAVRVVTARNLVHGALSLVVTLGGVAMVFLMLTAEFLAWVQVLIYVGAVIVLLLFGLMLTRAPIGPHAVDNEKRGIAALVAGSLFAVTGWVLWSGFGDQKINMRPELYSVKGLGTQIFTRYVLPFEVVSVLLLAALVGAVVLAKKD